MLDAVKPAATVLSDRVRVTSPGAVTGEMVDRLVWTSVFGQDAELRGTSRWIVRSLAATAGIRPASIQDLYAAMGRGEAGGFTVPAINIRAMAYDTARAVVRAANALNARALIFEISRGEMGYTEQRPHEYAASVLGAALREGFTGPVFIQGDHVQTNAKKYHSADKDKELDALRALIREELAAGFYNIDIDASTLVDLEKATLDEQQALNTSLAADFTAFIRQHEPGGMTVSVGGEIGEVGGKNSDVHELRAFMKGYIAALNARGAGLPGISKISVQTGTAHGGFVNADGSVRTDVKIDLKTLEELSRVARQEYGLAGAVQHGASTLPPDAFDAFPRAGACEIHLATDFQNIIYEHARYPADLKSEMYAWLREHAAEERKPNDTEEQFIYKTRKKALGPFKSRIWALGDEARRAIGQSLEERFSFLMKQLKITDTAGVVAKYVKAPQIPIDREAEIVAAGGTITQAEKEAKGLAD
ncbi:MAG TPA: class II fructose-bisphosphate aldolase [Vicinamibacterales bacterium]|nr:class II fructose-bisphosphate aldolase [Vicinamibacterales bacterium]